ncbi:MAG: 1-acyl-sn-glycerol-3-phosphate acyltransferase [Alphaproteobacteria bacterium]|nr:1-acyl-sn-glycerol-3-phosphate acyltransferase [Alphaproteobacteria bacterium]
MNRLRAFSFWLFFLFWTFVPTLLFVWVLALPRRKLATMIRYWERGFVLGVKITARLSFRVSGLEHIPDGACIIAAKHQSAFETCLLHLLLDDPAVVLKKELTYVPLWGWFAKASGLIPIDRKGGTKALAVMKRAARQAAQEGRKIVVFPQGTRVLPGVKKPYKVGMAVLYQDLNIPVVPVALNTGLFWPKGSFILRSGVAEIVFLPVIEAGLPRAKMMRVLEKAVEGESERLASPHISLAGKPPQAD